MLKYLTFGLFFFLSFWNSSPSVPAYQTGNHFILQDGVPWMIKGVVYVPVYPGYLPWDLVRLEKYPPRLKKRAVRDFQNLKAMGANTVRFWEVHPEVYRAFKQTGGMAFIQTIWFDVGQHDLQSESFKRACKNIIEKTVDRIYSVYSKEDPPPLIAYLAGNELSHKSIVSTNEAHPEIDEYRGVFVSAPKGSTASEAFLAEMADHLKAYESSRYGQTHLVSYANEIRTEMVLDTPFLDFRSFNAYSYAIQDYAAPPAGSHTGTEFQGWIESLKQKYPDKPLLITETGLSVSPALAPAGPPVYGYGGNTLADQADGLEQNWKDVDSAKPPLAGMIVHEYLDAWWKFGAKDSREHDPEDVEEWFGLASISQDKKGFHTEFREAYHRLKSIWNPEGK